MAKVTYSSTKGLVVETGTGFQVNDVSVLEEIESVTGSTNVAATIAAHGITQLTTFADGGAGATTVATVADGAAAGALKTIVLAALGDAGDDVQIVGTSVAGVAASDLVGDNMTLVGDFAHLVWTGIGWAVVSETTT